jgi:hypothetical protein
MCCAHPHLERAEGMLNSLTTLTHRRLPKVATEMALHVLAYNLTRVMNIMGAQPLLAAIRASPSASFAWC